jgi:hypothetical protein
MYANLLAAAMDKNTADGAHPAFVEIIKQLTSDEAKLIAYFLEPLPFPLLTVRADKIAGRGGYDVAVNVSLFGDQAGLSIPKLVPAYLDNLCRLGLIDIQPKYSYIDETIYAELESCAEIKMYQGQVALTPENVCNLVRGAVMVTNLGKQFGSICVKGHQDTPKNPE